jgi:hypothetical protein
MVIDIPVWYMSTVQSIVAIMRGRGEVFFPDIY